MPSQPYALACEGGLDKASSSFELLRRPGAATRLRNFEVDVAGGYRRINGFSILGGGSATSPNSTNQVLGLHVYADRYNLQANAQTDCQRQGHMMSSHACPHNASSIAATCH